MWMSYVHAPFRMCAPKEEITNNELPPILNAVQTASPPPHPPPTERRTYEPFCVVCEFAMHMVEKKASILNLRKTTKVPSLP